MKKNPKKFFPYIYEVSALTEAKVNSPLTLSAIQVHSIASLPGSLTTDPIM